MADALLDAYAVLDDARLLHAATSAAHFVCEDLNRSEDATGVCLSYSPLDHSAVYNASVLGACLLARVGALLGSKQFSDVLPSLVSYVLARQATDGSWEYGEAGHHRFVDSFHTGFVLCSLSMIAERTHDDAARRAVERGASFYFSRFFGAGGEPYYFADRRYPFDVHSAAQGVLTACELGRVQEARRIGRFLLDHFLEDDGHFIYQIRRTHRVGIPYMRWSQAWGVRALAELAARGIKP